MSRAERWILVCFLSMFTATSIFGADKVKNKTPEFSWPKVKQENKPWTYWWWMGSAVDKENLTQNMEAYQKAGMGGLHIVPIYGVKGLEDRFIDYLSPQWMQMLKHTLKEAKRLDMGIDMTVGTGWPFGGPQVNAQDAAAKVILQTYTLNADNRLVDNLQKKGTLQELIAYSDQGEMVNLTKRVDKNGTLDWTAPAGKWQVYALYQEGTGQQVKRAAPGAEGNVMDYFSRVSLDNYLARFDKAFADCQGCHSFGLRLCV